MKSVQFIAHIFFSQPRQGRQKTKEQSLMLDRCKLSPLPGLVEIDGVLPQVAWVTPGLPATEDRFTCRAGGSPHNVTLSRAPEWS